MGAIAGWISLTGFGISSFVVLLLLLEGWQRRTTRLLAACFLILSLTFLLRFSYIQKFSLIIYLPYLLFPLGLAYGPLAYLYVRASLFDDAFGRTRLVLCFLLPALAFPLHAFISLSSPEFNAVATIYEQAGPVGLYTAGVLICIVVQNSFFLGLSIVDVRAYKKLYAANYSLDERDAVNWLLLFIGMGLLMFLTMFALALVYIFVERIAVSPFEGAAALLLTYVLLYYLIRKPKVFALSPADLALARAAGATSTATPDIGREDPALKNTSQDSTQNEARQESEAEAAAKYSRQNLDPALRKEYLGRIQKFMEVEKPYLESELSLNTLAGDLGLPAHHCSMSINIELDQNFFTFVNSYRVREAIELLRDPDHADETLLNIGFRSGFQSKAAFNKVFKQTTGLTPGAYRKQALVGRGRAV